MAIERGTCHVTTEAFPITIYHNANCGTSLNALAIIRAAGYEPVVVEYLKSGWTAGLLNTLLEDMGISARDLLREKGTPAAELGLLSPYMTNETIVEAMVQHPILVNRPVVATPMGVKLCRPSELVLDLLDRKPTSFSKEGGEVLIL
jgi:arsenate reductase